MKTYRIGVLSNTHVPELWPALPDEVADTFRDVDLILHLGNVTGQDVLLDLGRLAPVVAVRGDHDLLPLPRQAVLHLEGMSLCLVHGKPALYRDVAALSAGATHVKGVSWWNALLGLSEGAIPMLHAVLFGSTNRPYMARHEGVLIFSPGSVYQRTPQMLRDELAKNPPFTQRLALQRLLDQAEKTGDAAVMPPSIGLLTIAGGVIGAEVLTISAASANRTGDYAPAIS